jgi:hypothetical protein
MKVVATIERVKKPSREHFEEAYVRRSQPVIITNAVNHWDALRRWSPAYLLDKIGRVKVKYKVSPSNVMPDLYLADISCSVRESTFAEYLGLIRADDKNDLFYSISADEAEFESRDTGPNPDLAVLMGDFSTPEYMDRSHFVSSGFWVSPAGVVSAIHYDGGGQHNLNVQVTGRKRVRLFSPYQAAWLYPFLATKDGPANFSQVHPERPDLKKFPKFADAECLEGVLEPGDMLFIPSFWFHSLVHCGKFNTNVNFWWSAQQIEYSPVAVREAFLAAFFAINQRSYDETAAALGENAMELLRKLEEKLMG